MIDEQRRRYLVEECKWTFEGVRCCVGGWKWCDSAGFFANFPGNWGVYWETLDRMDKRGQYDIKAKNAHFKSWLWNGITDEFPQAIREQFSYLLLCGNRLV